MYFDQNIKFNTILKWSPFEFIKRYESSIKKHGVKPLVSVTSGAGIFDYSDMVSKLNESLKKSMKYRNS